MSWEGVDAKAGLTPGERRRRRQMAQMVSRSSNESVDQGLVGRYAAAMECHIQPDWLFVYEKDDQQQVLIAYRTGFHADLF